MRSNMMRAKHVNSKQERRKEEKTDLNYNVEMQTSDKINSQVRCNVYIRLMISILLKEEEKELNISCHTHTHTRIKQ